MPARRILIIDDEDDIREVAQVSLELVAAWQVSTAASGEDGIRMAERAQPDAILLDVMMPDLDGPATVERLRAGAATRSIPVILLTAKVQATDRTRFAELEVAGTIAKPFDPLQLAALVAGILGWPS